VYSSRRWLVASKSSASSWKSVAIARKSCGLFASWAASTNSVKKL
jgi:hypothetical protein